MEIQIVLSLLSVTSQQARLIGTLNDCFKFDQNIFLAHPSANIDHLVGHETQPRSVFMFDDSNGNVPEAASLQAIQGKNTFVIVVPNSSTFQKNLNLLKWVKDIQHLGTNVKIGMFFPTVTSMDDVRRHFLWYRNQSVANDSISAKFERAITEYFHFSFVPAF